MNYKTRTIAACKKLAKDYSGKGHIINTNTCVLCKIYRFRGISKRSNCRGCISMGCIFHVTFPRSSKYLMLKSFARRGENGITCKSRAAFYTNIILLLKKIDAKYFTPTGYDSRIFNHIFKYDVVLKE